jgi:C-terminal processing protease CtpA/Prc
MKLVVIGLALTVAFAAPAAAQFMPPADQPDLTVDRATRTAVVDSVLRHLRDEYVFPEKAAEMERAIRRRVQRKEYEAITSAKVFAESLTAHLQAVSQDKHLRVRYSHEPLQPFVEHGDPSTEDRARMDRMARLRNYGFEKVERLRGNVGYLDLRGFMGVTGGAGATAAAAMSFLANSDALIVDLRQNGGGAPEMVALVSSYLFPEGERVHLNDLYFRPANQTTQFWTLPYVPGTRSAGKDVYVLTSRRTFSAAEEFTYNLKNLKRATIVGEVTGGGAHPGGFARLDEHFGAFIPSGRAINPISKTNWEGTGVKPDIEVPADQALKTAHLDALRKRVAQATEPMEKQALERAIEDVEKGEAAAAGPPRGGS